MPRLARPRLAEARHCEWRQSRREPCPPGEWVCPRIFILMSKAMPLLLPVSVLCLMVTVVNAAEPKAIVVWKAGSEGYHTYRIPAVLAAANGDLLAFCEGRRNNSKDHGNVDLVMKRSTDGGRTWGEQQTIHDAGGEEEVTIGNPCPVLDRETGTIWLPLARDNNRVLMLHSTDHGRTWSKPADVTESVKRSDWTWYATGPGVGIQLQHGPHAGRLVIPCDHRSPEYDCGAHVIYSDDHGKTWQLSENAVKPGANECQVVELSDGELLLNARMQEERQTGERGLSRSPDGGQTWSTIDQHSGLGDPRVQASLLKIAAADASSKPVLLFSNPFVPTSVERGKRRNLTVQGSRDEGKTWPLRYTLHAGPSAYSCLVDLGGGQAGCLYEAGEQDANETVRFQRFSLDVLRDAR